MRRRVARLVLATASLGSVLLLPLPAGFAASPAAVDTDTLAVAVHDVSPAVVVDGSSVTVTATVRNTGLAPVSSGVVVVRQDSRTLDQRADVARWAASTDPADGSVLASASITGSLRPGQQAAVTLRVPSVGAGRGATYGAVPVSLEARAGTAVGRQHTFLGYQRIKQYEPLRLGVGVPLVVGADPELDGTGPARAAAWAEQTGPGSRLDRVLTATADRPVTWLVDPQLVQEPVVPSPAVAPPTGTTTSSPSPAPSRPTGTTALTYAASPAEAKGRGLLGDRIRQAATSHDVLILPSGDPDVVASGVTPTMQRTTQRLVEDATAQRGGLRGRADVAWPAAGAWSAEVEGSTRAAYASGLSGAVVDSAWVDSGDQTATAERRSATGVPLVVYDDVMSALLAHTTSAAGAAVATQQIVADTAALVGEFPGTTRSLALVAPRSIDPDPAALNRLLTTVQAIPWLTPTSLDDILQRSAGDDRTASVTPPGRLPALRATPLTPASARSLETDAGIVASLAGVRADAASFGPPWEQAGLRLTATAWRGDPGGWTALRGRLQVAAASRSGLSVSPRQINFLAESGRVQIAVVNNLGVAVHDVHLTITPGNPRLRVAHPTTTVRIGARSKTTVTFEVTALAAGTVPITTTLTAPDGTVLSSGEPVQISVSPTGSWIYWGLGGLAGVLLVVGIWRGRRGRHPETGSATRMTER